MASSQNVPTPHQNNVGTSTWLRKVIANRLPQQNIYVRLRERRGRGAVIPDSIEGHVQEGHVQNVRTGSTGAPFPDRQTRAPRRHLEDCIRSVENAGFHVGSFMGPNRSAADREMMLGIQAANRRRVAAEEEKLWDRLIAQGYGLPPPSGGRHALLGGSLDRTQDTALFKWLESHNAFRGLRLNEDLRREKTGPRVGRFRTTTEIWEVLREIGYFWEIDPEFGGRWRNHERPLYTNEEEAETRTFVRILEEGGFATRGMRREFTGRDEYYMFRQVLDRGISWDSDRGVWTRGSRTPLFGDEVGTLQQRQQ